jgi:hypothetical protein
MYNKRRGKLEHVVDPELLYEVEDDAVQNSSKLPLTQNSGQTGHRC